jgi:hypothetical protein
MLRGVRFLNGGRNIRIIDVIERIAEINRLIVDNVAEQQVRHIAEVNLPKDDKNPQIGCLDASSGNENIFCE